MACLYGCTTAFHACRFDQCSISPISLKGIKDAGYEKMTVVQEATLPLILKGLFIFLKCLGLNYIVNVDQYLSLLFSKLRILSDYFINLLHSFSDNFQKGLQFSVSLKVLYMHLFPLNFCLVGLLLRTCTCVSR